MKAALIKELNKPLALSEVETPKPGKNEVLIRLHSAALNHRDVYISKGQYAGIELPLIPGSDGAGVIEDIGEGVDKSEIGKQVILEPSKNWGDRDAVQSRDFVIRGLPNPGTLAQYTVANVDEVFDMPKHLNFSEASALPLAGLTAYRALFSRANLKADEHVLITGIGGGVAQFALQFARSVTPNVYVTSGDDSKIEKAKEYGALGGINYKSENWHRTLLKDISDFDVIIDSAGGPDFGKLIDVAAPGGRIAIYGGTLGKFDQLSPQKIFWKQISILGSTMGNDADFRSMLDFVNKHHIKPIVDQKFKLEDINDAFLRMDKGEQMGKIVIDTL